MRDYYLICIVIKLFGVFGINEIITAPGEIYLTLHSQKSYDLFCDHDCGSATLWNSDSSSVKIRLNRSLFMTRIDAFNILSIIEAKYLLSFAQLRTFHCIQNEFDRIMNYMVVT